MRGSAGFPAGATFCFDGVLLALVRPLLAGFAAACALPCDTPTQKRTTHWKATLRTHGDRFG